MPPNAVTQLHKTGTVILPRFQRTSMHPPLNLTFRVLQHTETSPRRSPTCCKSPQHQAPKQHFTARRNYKEQGLPGQWAKNNSLVPVHLRVQNCSPFRNASEPVSWDKLYVVYMQHDFCCQAPSAKVSTKMSFGPPVNVTDLEKPCPR